jgi:hypothetical protein
MREDGDAWVRARIVRVGDLTIDVRRTDSLASPYIGICNFELKWLFTDKHATEDEAKKDNVFKPDEYATKYTRTYAYQKGVWLLKDSSPHILLDSGKELQGIARNCSESNNAESLPTPARRLTSPDKPSELRTAL